MKSLINKDSSNSSKPPSSDGYKKIPNNREKTGRSQGGQIGRKAEYILFMRRYDVPFTNNLAE
ncbi:MAG: DUF6444 domain-containing protein [Oscillospiraceae bacterium]|nr:DUF6444 domain-containing protein [Oscillospiraceae bacterium]